MTLANRYSHANNTRTIIELELDEMSTEHELDRDDVEWDLNDPYQRATYENFLTFSELEKVAWFHDNVVDERYDEYRDQYYTNWAPDVYGVPVHEHGLLIGAKVYQDQGYGFPWYVGFTPCTEDTFDEEVSQRAGIMYL